MTANLLYGIAAVLVFIWAVEFLVYGASGLVHALLLVALIAIVIRIVRGNRAI